MVWIEEKERPVVDFFLGKYQKKAKKNHTTKRCWRGIKKNDVSVRMWSFQEQLEREEEKKNEYNCVWLCLCLA